jgi:hypothetical protein
MIRRLLGAAAVVAVLAIPSLAQAQGVPGGVERGVRDYRYTVVNGRTVLVEPRTRRIVDIVE